MEYTQSKSGFYETVRWELRLRNYSYKTIKAYLSCLRSFVRYFKPRYPRELSEQDIRLYLLHLLEHKHFSAGTVNQVFDALRFLYVDLYKMSFAIGSTPRPKKGKQLPIVLDKDEVRKIVSPLDTVFSP